MRADTITFVLHVLKVFYLIDLLAYKAYAVCVFVGLNPNGIYWFVI